ncbi:putative prostate and testis expressed protein 2 isoform X2, partial [Sciurus carolinensis]|nr:putative prostate and testis expressed protein 2 isoform X2 [Sciurus carolinensis]
RFCNYCDYYDGYRCKGGMGTCWKLNFGEQNKSCLTSNHYLYDRLLGIYLYHYARLSCEPCEAGMLQIFQDVMRETFCCMDKNRCNNGKANLDMVHIIDHDD